NLVAPAVFNPVIGDPQIAIGVDNYFVRADEQPMTKALEEFAGGIEFEDGVERGAGTVCASRPGDATAIESPDVAIPAEGDASRRAPLPSVGQLAPAHAGK